MSKTVGVIGGMGPAATLDFFAKLLRATPAERDQDHLRVLIDSDPRVPDRNAAIAGRGPSPAPQLAATARRLQEAGADVLVIACNTAHAFEKEIVASVSIPLISMIEAATDAGMVSKPRRIGVLAADGCRRAGLYQRALAARDVEGLFLSDDAQLEFMQLIYRIKAGDTGDATRGRMEALATTLTARGANVVIAACTEVPLVLAADALPTPLIDSTEALVQRVVSFAGP